MESADNKGFEDLIFDSSFQEFAHGTNEQAIKFWESWLVKHPDKKEEFTKAIKVLRTLRNTRKSLVEIDKHQALRNLLQKIEKQQIKRKDTIRLLNPYILRIASIILITLIISSVWIWFALRKETSNQSYCEVIVPIGEKSQVILADGTHVWVNSGSHLKYPSKFGSKLRDVYLEGEAYFDVIRKENAPFIVNTKDVKVKVLGTAFNVKCYPDDVKTQTTVIRGLVQVESITDHKKSVLLRPNEMAIVSVIKDNSRADKITNIRSIEVKNVKTEPVICWKDQLLVFSDEPLDEIAVKLERWFNVKVKIVDKSLGKERYNGKFVHNETIYQVLEAIKFTTPITYKVTNNEIVIDRK